MYGLAVLGGNDDLNSVCGSFGDLFDLTDDLSQANVLAVRGEVFDEKDIPDSRLLFAVCDMTERGLTESALKYCADRGIAVFGKSPADVRDFIVNGNLRSAAAFPDIDLGPFGNDVSRIVIMMKGIDDPILLSAMMFSGMNVRAVAGGLCILPETGGLPGSAQDCDPSAGSDNEKSSADNDTVDEDPIYGCALVALREPVARIPHLDGVLKVRVLQDI